MTLASVAQERRRLEARLVAEGMPPEPDMLPSELVTSLQEARGQHLRGTRLGEMVEQLHVRQSIATAYFERAEDYLHGTNWARYSRAQRRVWRLHCEGLGSQEISEQTGTPVRTIDAVIARHRSLMNGD